MCVVGKNYRLQDIQLSKIIRGKNPSEAFGCLGISPRTPSARFTRSPLRRLAPFRSPELFILTSARSILQAEQRGSPIYLRRVASNYN
jgi:hypothetical protein